MLPLGIALAEAGYRVSAEDQAISARARRLLVKAGVRVLEYHEEAPAFDVLVRSSAVGLAHRLVEGERLKGKKVFRRGEALAQLVSGRRLIAVVGSHGKTTTAMYLLHLLRRGGLAPGFLVGGLPVDGTSPGGWGASEWFVAEVDESDGTIEGFHPEITLWLNFDYDHQSHYGTEASLRGVFERLVGRTKRLALVPQAEMERLVGAGMGADLRQLPEALPGEGLYEDWPVFNRLNGAAALEVAQVVLPEKTETVGLVDTPGVGRRQQILHRGPDGTTVEEDYAHHPTEIAALLDWAGQTSEGRRLVLIFQPHRYSRTRHLAREFATCIQKVDTTLLLPVYAASEVLDEGGTEGAILKHLDGWTGVRRVEQVSSLREGMRWLRRERKETGGPARYLFVGAGDLERLSHAWAAELGGGGLEQVWRSYLGEELSEGTRLEFGANLARRTTLRVGGEAMIYAEPERLEDLRHLVRAADLLEVDWFLIGGGSNLVIPQSGFAGMAIRLAGGNWRYCRIEEAWGEIEGGPGLRMRDLAGRAAEAGIGGFEFAEGIPGTLGGSLCMNAGAMGSWTLDRVRWVETLERDGAVRRWERGELHAGYRKCEELATGERIVVRAGLFGEPGLEKHRIRERMADFARRRGETQPTQRSAGCCFKNPEGHSAGALIEGAGLKGYQIGGAAVSGKHANFIVNLGDASATDVEAILQHVEEEVARVYGIRLEREVISPIAFSIDSSKDGN